MTNIQPHPSYDFEPWLIKEIGKNGAVKKLEAGEDLIHPGISLPVLPTATSTVQPERFQLAASPNPFSGMTTLRFTLPQTADVRLDLFDATGRPVRHLLQEMLPGGEHSVDIASEGLPQGVYFCRLMVAGEVTYCRVVVV